LKKIDYKDKLINFVIPKYIQTKTGENKQIIELQNQLRDKDKQLEEKDVQISKLIEKVGTINNVTIHNVKDNSEYIYMIKPRASVESNISVYKIGRTNNLNLRFQKYAKGGEIKYVYPCSNSKELETNVFEAFKDKFKQRHDFGREYFEGNFEEMVKVFKDICV